MCAGLTSLDGCKKEEAAAVTATPLDVHVVTVEQKDVPIFYEWVGTTDGLVNAKIRAQVTGYLLKQHYREGARSKKAISCSRSIRASFRPRSSRLRANAIGHRPAYQGEVRCGTERAVSPRRRDQPEGVPGLRSGQPGGGGFGGIRRGGVDQARLNLEWTKVVAPINGVVGVAKAQIGDLVIPTTR